MGNAVGYWRAVSFSLLVLAGLAVPGCRGSQPHAAATQPGMGDRELHAVLPELAKGHSDKVQLAWYAGSFLRRMDPEVKAFAVKMGAEHKRLAGELKGWAQENHFDTTFHYDTDVLGRARKAMEDEQGHVMQSDSNVDFQRDLVMFMYQDYDWQLAMVRALLPGVQDAKLRAYLEDSQRVHEEGLKQLRQLMQDYRWTPPATAG